MHSQRVVTVALLPLVVMCIAGCPSQKTTTSLGSAYEKANQGAIDLVAVESKQIKRVRRLAAIVAYINNPSLDVAQNLNAKQIPRSFVNFVCTGTDDFDI